MLWHNKICNRARKCKGFVKIFPSAFGQMRWSESSLGIETLLTFVIVLTSNMTVTQNICRSRWRTASRRPEWTLLTALHKALTYLSVGWSEGWGPCQRTTKSGGFDEKTVGWDCSGDVWETCWKLKWLQAAIPPPKKNTQLTVSISEAKCLKKILALFKGNWGIL